MCPFPQKIRYGTDTVTVRVVKTAFCQSNYYNKGSVQTLFSCPGIHPSDPKIVIELVRTACTYLILKLCFRKVVLESGNRMVQTCFETFRDNLFPGSFKL